MNKKVLYGVVAALGIACGYLLMQNMEMRETSNGCKLSGDPKFKTESVKEGASKFKKLDTKKNPFAKKVSEQKPTGPLTEIRFDKMIHDFGNIEQDTKNEHTFYFTNTGTNPLIISSARGSCGCTVPKYPTEPVAPGAQAEINVVFSSGKKKGKQNKSITLTANTDPQQTKIYIKADIALPAESEQKPTTKHSVRK